jgi:hypothetical protein
VIAFGSVGQRFDGAAIGRCNATATVETAPSAPAPPEEVAPKPAPAPAAEPTGPMVPTSTPDDAEALCNGRDDDADGRVDEGLRVRTWEDRDRDLFGDPGLGLEVCPQQLRPGLVLNDYDCDDSDPKRNPSRDNCP